MMFEGGIKRRRFIRGIGQVGCAALVLSFLKSVAGNARPIPPAKVVLDFWWI